MTELSGEHADDVRRYPADLSESVLISVDGKGVLTEVTALRYVAVE